MNKSKEITLIYKHMYIHTHPGTFKHIYKYRYTFAQKHIRQCFLTLCLKVFKLFAFLIESGKLLQIKGPI